MEDAIVVAFLRGRAVSQNRSRGLMLAVGIGKDDAEVEIKGRYRAVNIACHNSPHNVTLSGDVNEILAIKELFEAKNIFTRLLVTDGNAYHSTHMCKLGSAYESQLVEDRSAFSSSLHFHSQALFLSSVTGRRWDANKIEAAYWRRNLESPVLFQEAVEELARTTHLDVMIEVDPHAALRSAIEQISKSLPNVGFPAYCPTLYRGYNSATRVLGTAGYLWTRGHSVSLERVNAIESIQSDGTIITETGNVIADLPRYQWQYDNPLVWENRQTREWRTKMHPRHDILGSRVPGLAKGMPTWRNILTHKHLSWLKDHHVMCTPLMG